MKLLTRRDVAHRLRRHVEYVNALVDVLDIQNIVVGQSICIREEDLPRLMQYRRLEPANAEPAAASA